MAVLRPEDFHQRTQTQWWVESPAMKSPDSGLSGFGCGWPDESIPAPEIERTAQFPESGEAARRWSAEASET